VKADLDTLLTALYVALTDDIIPSRGIRQDAPGRPAEVTDAELVCLAVAQAHLGFVRERRWLRAAPKLVGHLFPRLLSQSEYNRRLRRLSGLMVRAVRWLAEHTPSFADVVRLVDGTKIICGMSRETVKHSDLFGYCGYGYDASHSLYFWGMKLMLLVAPDGLVTGFILVNPKLYGEHEATLMMLAVPENAPAPGSTAVGDKGFRGRQFEADVLAKGIVLVRPACAGEADAGVFPKWLRQRVESVIESLKGQLGIEHPGAHKPDGLFTRVVQRLLALNTAIWHNWAIGADRKRSLIAYDH
jgi:hypothetical protein